MAKKKNRRPQQTDASGMSRKEAKRVARAAERAALLGESRPYEGLAAEPELVALQEFVPSATARVEVSGTDRTVYICTVLPGAVHAVVRDDEVAFVALQTQRRTKTQGKDLACALEWVRDAAPGSSLSTLPAGTHPAPLTELLDPEIPLPAEAHDNFGWWLTEGQEPEGHIASMLQRANDAIVPSAKISADVPGALWWVDTGDKAHIRWVRQESEESLLAALARIGAAGDLHLGEDTKFAGVFRTHGLIVPVFDLDPTMVPEEFVGPIEALSERIDAELANDAPLTADERRSLQNIKSRQVTIR